MGEVKYASQVKFQIFLWLSSCVWYVIALFLRLTCKTKVWNGKEREPLRGIVIIDHGKGLDYK